MARRGGERAAVGAGAQSGGARRSARRGSGGLDGAIAARPGRLDRRRPRRSALLRPHFRGESWHAWRVFLAALFALPLNDEDLAIYQRHTGRTAPPTQPLVEAAL